MNVVFAYRAPINGLRAAFVLPALGLFLVLWPYLAIAEQTFVDPSSVQIDAQAQFDAGEFDVAIKAALTSIDVIESKGWPFEPAVADQYRMLADARFMLGETEEALRAYSLGRQELRMLGGLHTLTQLALL